MVDILGIDQRTLKEQFKGLSIEGYRVKQIFDWLYKKRVYEFDQMTNLSKELRQKLKQNYYISRANIVKKLVSKVDNTVKYLYEFDDHECAEAVMMEYHHGNSLCISTQIGCRMGCTFCASTKAGFVRNLSAGEMLSEIIAAEKDSGKKVNSLVLMGIGEPLDNFENVMQFLEVLSDPDGIEMSLRHVSLSTCGLVEKIEQLKERKMQLTLSISLHAPNDEIRSKTMPVNSKWNIAQLIQACRNYTEATGRRISFEYAMISGVNDSEECAKELAALLKGMICHVNLIPVNEVRETEYRQSKAKKIERFKNILEQHHINVTIRRTLGADIEAACGQLRRDNISGR